MYINMILIEKLHMKS